MIRGKRNKLMEGIHAIGRRYRVYQEMPTIGQFVRLYNFDSTWTGGPFNTSAAAPSAGPGQFPVRLPPAEPFPSTITWRNNQILGFYSRMIQA